MYVKKTATSLLFFSSRSTRLSDTQTHLNIPPTTLSEGTLEQQRDQVGGSPRPPFHGHARMHACAPHATVPPSLLANCSPHWAALFMNARSSFPSSFNKHEWGLAQTPPKLVELGSDTGGWGKYGHPLTHSGHSISIASPPCTIPPSHRSLPLSEQTARYTHLNTCPNGDVAKGIHLAYTRPSSLHVV